MKHMISILLFTGLVAVIMVGSVSADVFLEANFDGHTPDDPIGTGGAALGEPISVSPQVIATVRSEPMPTASLQITDNDDFAAGAARFEFLDDQEISTGVVSIVFDLWFTEYEDFYVGIREQGSSASAFLDLIFTEGRSVDGWDETSYYAIADSYPLNQNYHVALMFDMDAGTYDVWLNETQAIENRVHGIEGDGIGSVSFSCAHDPDVGSSFYVDNIQVSDTFVAVDGASWGRVKALYFR
jgi:hypothetical protein